MNTCEKYIRSLGEVKERDWGSCVGLYLTRGKYRVFIDHSMYLFRKRISKKFKIIIDKVSKK